MKNIVWTSQGVCVLGLMMLSGCTSTSPSLAPAQLGTSQDQATIQALQQRLHERERTISKQNYQIEVISSQLEALKRIDQDTREQWRPVRRSMTGAP